MAKLVFTDPNGNYVASANDGKHIIMYSGTYYGQIHGNSVLSSTGVLIGRIEGKSVIDPAGRLILYVKERG
jgi:predicted nucleotidyltransferase